MQIPVCVHLSDLTSPVHVNSKGENSANNHVNTNVPILTDRRQVYISPNIEQTIDHSSSECKLHNLRLLCYYDMIYSVLIVVLSHDCGTDNS
jgi:hypothetical protein